MYCEYCGKQIPDGSLFCIACGKKQSGPPAAETQPEPAAAPVWEQPAPQAEPMFQSEPESQAEPVLQSEPAPQAEPVFQSEPAPQAEPVLQSEPAPQAEPVFQSEPASQAEPMFQSEPEPAQNNWQQPQGGGYTASYGQQSQNSGYGGYQQQSQNGGYGGYQQQPQNGYGGYQQQGQNGGYGGWQQQGQNGGYGGWQQQGQNGGYGGWQQPRGGYGQQGGYGGWQQEPYPPREERRQPVYRNGRIDYGCPMNWYKYLIYFTMIPSAFFYLFLGVAMLAAMVLNDVTYLGYGGYYGLENPLYMVLPSFVQYMALAGVICIAYGVLMLVSWVKMIRLRRGGWCWYIVLAILPVAFFGINLLTTFMRLAEYSRYLPDEVSQLMLGFVIILIVEVVILILQIVYFRKRDYLFVN